MYIETNDPRNGKYQIAFVSLLKQNGIYDYMLRVFDQSHTDPEGIGYGGLRGYLRFTDPEKYVINLSYTPTEDLKEFDTFWREYMKSVE